MRETEAMRVDSLAASREVWNREYETLQVIPSSTRQTPSKALLQFAEILRFDQLDDVLEVGCGNGRNAVYLAQKGCLVKAIDFSHVALSETRNAAIRAGVQDRIQLNEHSIYEGLPFQDEAFDLVVDSYVFCHFTDEEVKRTYRRELHRVVRTGGSVFCSVFLTSDQYYEALIKNHDEQSPIVIDPRNGITKQLYSSEAIRRFFSEDFEIPYCATLEFEDIVQGLRYRRCVYSLILEKAGG